MPTTMLKDESQADQDEEITKAIYNPGSVFKNPKDILDETQAIVQKLSTKQKIELLKRWAFDEQEREKAEEENMRPNSQSSRLAEVLAVLNVLEKCESESSSKHHPKR